jgi:phage-related protein
MNISVNNFDIGSLSTNVDLKPGIQGLTIPSIRTATGDFSGKDGGWVSAQFYGKREIVIDGELQAKTRAASETLRADLQTALPIRTLLPVIVTTPNGDNYYTSAYVIDLKMAVESKFYAPFQLTLLAPDPYFYKVPTSSDTSEGWTEETLDLSNDGGYETPYILPIVWSPGSTPVTINNPNVIEAYPQIILTGAFTNPRITNTTTGQYIELTASTVSGDEVIFDLYNRTVTLNGGSVLASLEAGSTWWPLETGDNLIELTTDSGSDDGTAVIRYRLPYPAVFF